MKGSKLAAILKVKLRIWRVTARAGEDYQKVGTLKLGIGNPFPTEEDRLFDQIDRQA